MTENEEPPSSPSVKKTEEKGVIIVHEVKCKLYVKVMIERQHLSSKTKNICRMLVIASSFSQYKKIRQHYLYIPFYRLMTPLVIGQLCFNDAIIIFCTNNELYFLV